MVDWKFDRAVEIDRVVFSLHRRGLVGEKRFESKRPIFGTVLPGPALYELGFALIFNFK